MLLGETNVAIRGGGKQTCYLDSFLPKGSGETKHKSIVKDASSFQVNIVDIFVVNGTVNAICRAV